MRRKLLVILLFLLLLLPIGQSIASSQSTATILYERYSSIYITQNETIIPLHGESVIYQVRSTTLNTTANIGGVVEANSNITTYTLIFSSILSNVSGYVNLQVSNDMVLILHTNLPNLIRVIVNTSNTSVLVWAGINATNVKTYAYLNGSGYVILQFANASNIAEIKIPVKIGENITIKTTLQVYEIKEIEISSTFETHLVIQTNLPRRYEPINFSGNYTGMKFMFSSEGITATTAYFNGSFVPALVWKGEGLQLMTGIRGGHVKSEFKTIEFYGVNGTTLGYVHLVTVKGSGIRSVIMPSLGISNILFSEVKIVLLHGYVSGLRFIGLTYINGHPVVIIVNDKDHVESTAYVLLSHKVSHGFLAFLSLNNSIRVILLTPSNVTFNVSLVKPINVIMTNVSINGSIYKAEKVIVNSTNNSYIVFNVSIVINVTIKVYKVVNGELVSLNNSDYFIVNKSIVVFDDPSITYYIVYMKPQSTPNTTIQTSTSTTLTSYTTTTQISSTLTATQITSNKFPITLIVIIIIILLIIILAVTLTIRRK